MKEKLIVSIADFGAVPDSDLQTDRIQAAIDHCFLKGGGEVQIPGGLYRTGSIRLRSRVTLHLLENAVLEGSSNWQDYDILDRDTVEPIPKTEQYTQALRRWNHGIIRAVDAEDIAIIGEPGSLIDGQDCYDPDGEEGFRGPHAINMFYCRNLTFRGYTIEDSANWAHCIFHSVNIEARNLTVLGGHDGFHIRGCTNSIIEDCVFHTGDDCVAGYADINVVVRNCELNTSCSAFRFGGTNVLVEHCKAWGPGIYGHRYTMSKEEQAASAPTNHTHRHASLGFFTYFSDLGIKIPCQPGNIIVRDCTVDTYDRFFQFNFSGSDKWQRGEPVKNVRFENMAVANIKMPIVVYSTEDVKTVFEMRNVTYSMAEGSEMVDPIHAANFERLSFHNVKFSNVHCGHLIKTWDDGGILETDGLEIAEGVDAVKVRAKEAFAASDV